VTVQAISSGRWTNIENTVFENYAVRSLGYGNGRFIAAGDSGRMAHSVDGGRSWVSVESGTGLAGNKFVSTVYAVAFGASLFYAVGADARMSFSVNGVNWTGHRLPGPTPPPSEPPPPPVYGEVLFAGEAGLKDVRAVVFGRGPSALDGRFVAAGADGRAAFWNSGMSVWAAGTGIEPEHKIKTLAWGNVEGGRFIAAGTDGAVYRATDGTGTQSWQRAGDSTFGDNTVNASVFGNGVFVIGGNAGRMAWSNNGLEWNAVDSSVIGDSDVLSLAFGSGLFVAGTCSGILAWSANGIDWEPIPDGGFGPGERVNGIATNGRGRFVAAGNCSAGNAGRIVSWYQRPMAHSQTGGGE